MSAPNLSIQQKSDLATLQKMPLNKKFNEEMRQQAALEILSKNKPLRIAIIHANFQVKRANRSCGFESLDAENEDGECLYDKIAAKNNDEDVDWRLEALDICSEQLLDFIRNGGAAVGRAMNLSDRSGQLKIVELIKRVKSENEVKKGEKGQFGLDFGGAI